MNVFQVDKGNERYIVVYSRSPKEGLNELTVSRKTAKNLAVRRKNERILTVSRYKMLTVKKSNHRSKVLEIFC